MAIIIYCFPIYLLTTLIGPTKSSPHFINGSSGRLVTSFARLWVGQFSYSLTCITRFIVIMHILIHNWPLISNIQYFFLHHFSCKMPSLRSFMQFFHHHICFCCCQTLSQFIILAHFVQFTILQCKRFYSLNQSLLLLN
jgi:hypothetical protein